MIFSLVLTQIYDYEKREIKSFRIVNFRSFTSKIPFHRESSYFIPYCCACLHYTKFMNRSVLIQKLLHQRHEMVEERVESTLQIIRYRIDVKSVMHAAAMHNSRLLSRRIIGPFRNACNSLIFVCFLEF